jgi:AcrR family transcriptional regulator
VSFRKLQPALRHLAAGIAFVLCLRVPMMAGDAAGPVTVPGLHNTFRVTERILSGSQPDGDAAFAALAQLGVKVIVSVDGAKPDLARAVKYGLRYVHLPIGYDGVPAARVAELARAATAQPGSIYVHCHHGKHRGPAAVAVMCEAVDGWSRERAEAWLRQAGTADDYPGLYRAVREFQPVTEAQLARVGALPEVAKTPALVDAMVTIDERFDALKAAQKAGWKPPADQPDLAPAHEATLLWEHLRELARTEETAQRPADYRAKLADSEAAADGLRTGLRGMERDLPALDAAFKKTAQSCTDCHTAHRNKMQ